MSHISGDKLLALWFGPSHLKHLKGAFVSFEVHCVDHTATAAHYSCAVLQDGAGNNSRSSIWGDTCKSCSVCSGSPAMNAHCRHWFDTLPNRTASLRSSAKKTSTVSPGQRRHAVNCFHVAKRSKAKAVYRVVFMYSVSARFSSLSCWYTAYAPPDKRIRTTHSICFTPLNQHISSAFLNYSTIDCLESLPSNKGMSFGSNTIITCGLIYRTRVDSNANTNGNGC